MSSCAHGSTRFPSRSSRRTTPRPSLGDNRREALKIAAGFRGEEAFDAGVAEDEALETVLPYLSRERSVELANECLGLYLWDRLGSDN